MTDDPLILAIETSQVGSVSLIKGSEEVDFWIGNKENSRSQDLLSEIASLLDKNGITKKEIELIAVATGPGSFTGLRVGISVSIGLSQALGCARIGIPTLSAMAFTEPDVDLICVVPAGKEQCYWQAFKEYEAKTEIHLINNTELNLVTEKHNGAKIVSEFHLADKLRSILSEPDIISAPENLARLIGLSAFANYATQSQSQEIVPLYVRDATVRL